MHTNVRHSRRLRRMAKRRQMILMTVHPPIRNQPQKVQPLPLRLRKRLLHHRLRRQLPLTDRLVNPRQILIHNPPRPQVEVPHLTVPHLPIRQPHILTRTRHLAPRTGRIQLIMKRRLRQQRRIPILRRFLFPTGIDPPAITNDQNNRFFGHKQNKIRV